MVLRAFALRRNDSLKRSRARRPRIEWMEPRTVLSPPTVTGLSPTSGPEAGGTLVTISGTSFTGATAVDFGTTAATNLDRGQRHHNHGRQSRRAPASST